MTFTEPFNDPDVLLGRFSRFDFRTQWPVEGGTGPGGQDTNGGHGTDLPDNVRITAGQLTVETGMQNYGETIVRSNTPWAGTGTIEFDVVGDVVTVESYVVVLILDRPYVWTGYDGDNANGPKPQYGIGFQARNPHGLAWSNFVQTWYFQGGTGGIPNGTYERGVLQHWVITMSAGGLQLTIDGDDTDIGTGSPRKIPLPAGFNPVGSWISIGTHNHASIKYTPFVETCTTRFDNLTYTSLPALAARTARVPISGPNVFGWHLTRHGSAETPIVHETTDLALGTGATAAWLLVNIGNYGGDADATSRLWYSLNGNTEHQVALQIAEHAFHATMSLSIPVTLSELVHGINTVRISESNFGNLSPAGNRYANIELVVQGGTASISSRKVRIGAVTPSVIKLGTLTIGKIYKGTTEVWAGPPPVPTGLAPTTAVTSVTLTWAATSSATRYVSEYRLHKNLTTQYADGFDFRTGTTAPLITPWVSRIGSGWTITETGGDVGNVATDSTGVDSIATPANIGALLTTDGYVEAAFTMAAGAATMAVHMRGTSTTATVNEAAAELTTGGVYQIVEIIAGTRNVRAATGAVYTAGTTVMVRLECVGNQATLFVDNVSTLTATLTTLLTGTQCSMRMNRTGSASIDNFRMGTFAIGGWQQWSTPTVTNTVVTGLTTGQQYDFRVAAYNNYGRGDYTSIVSAIPAAAPPVVPTAPTLTTATPRNLSVDLVWTAPASNGGAPITSYTVEKSPNGSSSWTTATVTALTASSATVTGLTNSVIQYFRVYATNSVGNGAVSNTMSATPIPPTAPGAPTLTAATPGNATVALTWTAPASDGGATITSYTVEKSPNGTSSWTTATVTALTLTGATATGLTNGTIQHFRVSAINTAGTGTASNVLSATPTAGVVYTDDFNRANGALTTPWVHVEGTHSINSNKVVVGTTSPTVSYYNQTFNADHWAEADLASMANTGGRCGLVVRVNGSNFYFLWRNGKTFNIVKRVGGSYDVGLSTTTVGAAYKVRFEAKGTTLRAYTDGVLAFTVTDSSVATGGPGIMSADGGPPTFDNFRCGNLPYTAP